MKSRLQQAHIVDVYVGRRLLALRIQRGLSQEELGQSLSISFQQIQKYERGVNRIAAGTLYQLAKALKTPIGFFYEGAPNQYPVEGGQAVFETNPTGSGNFSRETVALALAFSSIKSPRVRRRLLKFIVSMAEEGDAPED